MKTLIFAAFYFAGLSQNLMAQATKTTAGDTSTNYQNSWYFEIAGASLIGTTFNYERHLSKKTGGFSMRIGLGGGIVPSIFDDNTQFFGAIPAGIYYDMPVSNNNRNFVEFGGTYTFIFSGGDYNAHIISANIGWRYQPSSSKLLIKVIAMPLVYSLTDKAALGIPWVGFSIGTRF